MSRNSLLEAGTKSEGEVTAAGLEATSSNYRVWIHPENAYVT